MAKEINAGLQIVYRKLSEMHPNPKNPRKQGDDGIVPLAESIEANPQFFEARPILLSDRTGKLVIIGDERRWEAAQYLERETAPSILFHGLTEEQEDEIMVRDNTHAGVWDELKLQSWDKGKLLSWNVDGVKWPKVQKQAKEDDFNPEKKVKSRVKPGELWKLGQHRLMCGDSTDAKVFAKLMKGERADIAFTSPPYGVNDGSIRKHQEKGKSDIEAKNFYNTFDDNQIVWPRLIEETWQRMHEHTDQQFINIQMLADNKRELVRWCARHADNLVDILIWDKGYAAPQMQSNIVNNNYEFIYVFGDDNANRVIKHGNFHGDYGAIVRVGVGQNKYADIHKAVFPVALPAEILKICGNAKSVLDCFGGTGSTMIAAEQLGRKCYMIELDPLYCDVIIDRWEQFSGKKAEKIQ